MAEERKREKEAAAAGGRTDDDGRPVGCDDSDGEDIVMRERENRGERRVLRKRRQLKRTKARSFGKVPFCCCYVLMKK